MKLLAQNRHDVLPPAAWTPAVIAALQDPDAEVRKTAAATLGHWPYMRSYAREFDERPILSPLIAALDDSSAEVRIAVIRSLGLWRSSFAHDALVPLLDDDALRPETALALARIGDRRAVSLLRSLVATHEPFAIQALGELRDSESVAALIGVVADRAADEAARIAAVKALAAIGNRDAVPILIAALDDASAEVAASAARALGEFRDPRAAAPLLAAAGQPRWSSKNPPWRGRENPTRFSLVRLGADAVEPLAHALSHSSAQVREIAAEALFYLSSSEKYAYHLKAARLRPAFATLGAALDDPSPEVRKFAVLALANVGDPRAISALSALVHEKELEGLDKLTNVIGPALTPQNVSPLRNTSAVEILVQRVGDEQISVRMTAIRTLALIGDPRGAAALIPLLQDPNKYVLAQAVDALSDLKSPAAVAPLVERLSDDSEWVRNQIVSDAADRLGRLGDPRAVEPLAKLAYDVDVRVRVQAGLALTRLGDSRGKPLVFRELAAPTARNREATLRILQDNPELLEVDFAPFLLAGLFDNSWFVRYGCQKILGRSLNDFVSLTAWKDSSRLLKNS